MVLNKSRVSVKKSNVEDTTSTNQIKFVEAVQSCFNTYSKTFIDLFRVAFAEKTLWIAWHHISKKKLDKSSKENFNNNGSKVFVDKIKEISTCLINSCYKFGVLKRAWIYRKNTNKKHFLTISSPFDKIVLYSVYMVLQLIFNGLLHDLQLVDVKSCKKIKKYDPLHFDFLKDNYEIKQDKSPHQVLRNLQAWHYCCWFIRIDSNRLFNQINQNRLINILRETVDDEPLLAILQQMFNKKVFFYSNENKSGSDIKLSQRNNLEALLANIYLKKLDAFILKRKKLNWDKNNFNKKLRKTNSLRVTSGKNAILRHKNYNFMGTLNQQKNETEKWMGLIKKTTFINGENIIAQSFFCPRVYYNRYFEHFILGIYGPKILAIDVKDEASQFIKCNLQLELQFVELHYVKSSKVKYLGFDIKVPNHKRDWTVKLKKLIAFNKLKNKLKQEKLNICSRKKTLFRNVFFQKARHKTSKAVKNVINKINCNKSINQRIRIELLNVLNDFSLEPAKALKSSKLANLNKNIWDVKQKKIKFAFNQTAHEPLYNYKHRTGPRLYIPKKYFLELMRSWGMLDNILNKPIPNKILLKYHDINIILYYKSKALNSLKYYRPAKNFDWIKKQINYQMRYSLLFTLAKKHKTSASKIIQIIGKNANVYIDNGSSALKKIASFLTSSFIHNQKSGFNETFKLIQKLKVSKEFLIKTSIPKTLYHECQIKGCRKSNVKIFHLRVFYKKISPNFVIASLKIQIKKMHWIKALELVLGKKQVPLCHEHHLAIYKGQLFLEDIETNMKSFKLLNMNGLDLKF